MENSAIAGLKPEIVWKYFWDVAQVPRPSFEEDQIMDWLKQWAKDHGLEYKEDGTKNLVIKKPGSGGGESAPPVCIQCHTDMVCCKVPELEHDFKTDSIKMVRDGNWITADRTTLGADDGIGVAYALALLDQPDGTKLPPLECLFTVREEADMGGIIGLDAGLVTARLAINVDTEQWGNIYIGSAGHATNPIRIHVGMEAAPAAHVALKLAVSGLQGGHSGVNINEERGNANVFVIRLVDALMGAVPGARLASMTGGEAFNALTRDAEAVVTVAAAEEEAARAALGKCFEELVEEYGRMEEAMKLDVTAPEGAVEAVMGEADGRRFVQLASLIPHGIQKWSHSVKDLVETSNNLGIIRVAEGEAQAGGKVTYEFGTMCRSMLSHGVSTFQSKLRKITALTGAELQQGDVLPGWTPNPDSPLLEITKDVMWKMNDGEEPWVGAIHAGLECGMMAAKMPGLDVISVGPTITGAHSPDERVEIDSVGHCWELLLRVLARIVEKYGSGSHPGLAGMVRRSSSARRSFTSKHECMHH